MSERESLFSFDVNRYDGLGPWLLGMRYQASPNDDRSPVLCDPCVYARTYKRAIRKAIHRFGCVENEPVGRFTGHTSSVVGRQVEIARVVVQVNPYA